MSYDSDLSSVIKRAAAQGFRHSTTEKGHHQFYAPDGHTIVTKSGTPSDQRGWLNFMADMKRAGYQHELQSLADAMPENVKALANGGSLTLVRATATAPTRFVNPEGDKRTGNKVPFTTHLREFMERHPEGAHMQDITAYMLAVRPDLIPSSSRNAVNQLEKEGTIVRVYRGFYRLASSTSKPLASLPTEPAPEPLSTGNAGVESGDERIDADLKELDDALAALARIEQVVRKNREVLHQLAALKKLLGVK